MNRRGGPAKRGKKPSRGGKNPNMGGMRNTPASQNPFTPHMNTNQPPAGNPAVQTPAAPQSAWNHVPPPPPAQKEEPMTDPFAENKGKEPLVDPFADNKKEESLTDPFAEKKEELNDPFAEKKEESSANPFADHEKKEVSLTDPFAEKKDEPMADPFAEKKDEPMADPFAEKKDEPMADPFAEKKDEPMADPFAEKKKDESLTDPFANTKKDEPPANPSEMDQSRQREMDMVFNSSQPLAKRPSQTLEEIEKLKTQKDQLNPFASLTPKSDDPFGEVSPSNGDLFEGMSIQESPQLESVEKELQTPESPKEMVPPSMLFNPVHSPRSQPQSRPSSPRLERLRPADLIPSKTPEDLRKAAEAIGIDMTIPETPASPPKAVRAIDVVEYFAEDDDFASTEEDGRRLRILFDNMLPVVAENPVIPEPEEMAEQVMCKSRALLTQLETMKVSWMQQQKKKKLIRQVNTVLNERCYSTIGYDIKVCEKAMKKAKAKEEKNKQQVEMAKTSIAELEKQKEGIMNAIEERLKKYVSDKNGLTEIANREIEEFNVMYEVFEATCKNWGVSVEEVLTEGATDRKSVV